MKKKIGAFGAGQFSLGTLVEGRPGTTIFQTPGGGGGLGGVAYKDPAQLPPRASYSRFTAAWPACTHVDKSAKRSFGIISRFHAGLSKLWPRRRQMRLLPAPSAV